MLNSPGCLEKWVISIYCGDTLTHGVYFLQVVTCINKEASRLYAELLCRRGADDICHPPVKSSPKSNFFVSSTRHLYIVRTSSARDFNPKNISS